VPDQPKNTADHLKQIVELQTILASADFDLKSFTDIVVGHIQGMTGATGATVELLEADEMVYRAAGGSLASFVNCRIKAASSLAGQCACSGEVLRSDDTSADPRVDKEACWQEGAASIIVVPLLRNNKTVGAFKIVSNQKNTFDESDVQTLRLMAGLLGSALSRKTGRQNPQDEGDGPPSASMHDELTGLPNRNLLYDRLTHALARSERSKKGIALMSLNIDGFKKVNEAYGMAAGDALLKEFARRVGEIVRTSDSFARMEDDKFVLIIEPVNARAGAERVANKIMESVRLDFLIGGKKLKIGTSIGIAMAEAGETSADILLQQADRALLTTQELGGNRICFDTDCVE
jgi:diguanylate cyclase (GGDEF)-like protein